MRLIDADILHKEISAWPESVMYKDWVQSAITSAPTISMPAVLPLDKTDDNDLISRKALLQTLIKNGWLKMNALEDSAEMIAVQAAIDDAPSVKLTLHNPEKAMGSQDHRNRLPSKPLTLDELNRMYGEPVYIDGRYFVLEYIEEDEITDPVIRYHMTDGTVFERDANKGTYPVFYRHKPESRNTKGGRE